MSVEIEIGRVATVPFNRGIMVGVVLGDRGLDGRQDTVSVGLTLALGEGPRLDDVKAGRRRTAERGRGGAPLLGAAIQVDQDRVEGKSTKPHGRASGQRWVAFLGHAAV